MVSKFDDEVDFDDYSVESAGKAANGATQLDEFLDDGLRIDDDHKGYDQL